jgi:hypothetical protein
MEKVFIRSYSGDSSLSILTQNVTIGGAANIPIEVDYDIFVKKAVAGGAAVLVDEKTAKKLIEESKKDSEKEEGIKKEISKVPEKKESEKELHIEKEDSEKEETLEITDEIISDVIERGEYAEMKKYAIVINPDLKGNTPKKALKGVLLDYIENK